MKSFVRIVLILFYAHAFASSSVVVTPTPGDYVLRNADNTEISTLKSPANRFKTEPLCLDAPKTIPLPTGKYKCDRSIGLSVVTVATCSDEAAPSIDLIQVDDTGQKYWELPGERTQTPPEPTEANNWAVMRYVYVPNPKGDAGYPACWIRGWAPEQTWRMNPNYPGTPKMELIVPNMPPIAEAPNSIEPTTTPAGFQEEWESPAREAERHEKCECYASDKTPCPPIPGPNCPAANPARNGG